MNAVHNVPSFFMLLGLLLVSSFVTTDSNGKKFNEEAFVALVDSNPSLEIVMKMLGIYNCMVKPISLEALLFFFYRQNNVFCRFSIVLTTYTTM